MEESKEILEQKVYESFLLYGGSDERTVSLSQKLDIIVVFEQRSLTGINKCRC